MRILVLDAALGRAGVAVVVGDAVVAAGKAEAMHGQAQALAPMVVSALSAAGLPATALDLVAVTVGPGSFTGLRAALSVAQGIGLAAGRPVIGVTVAEALADALPLLGIRALWTAIDSRRGRVFLDRPGQLAAAELDALPVPDGPIAVAGDAAIGVAARLAAGGADVMLTDARRPQPRHIAAVAARRQAGSLPPLPIAPVYVDAPEARPARGGRPPPA